jgi:hypothetical protein
VKKTIGADIVVTELPDEDEESGDAFDRSSEYMVFSVATLLKQLAPKLLLRYLGVTAPHVVDSHLISPEGFLQRFMKVPMCRFLFLVF